MAEDIFTDWFVGGINNYFNKVLVKDIDIIALVNYLIDMKLYYCEKGKKTFIYEKDNDTYDVTITVKKK